MAFYLTKILLISNMINGFSSSTFAFSLSGSAVWLNWDAPWIVCAFLVLLVALFIGHRNNKLRIKKLTEVHKQLEEKYTALIQERHSSSLLPDESYHRVKNNLQFVSSLLNMYRRSSDHPDVKLALQDAVMRLQSMSLVHQKLYTDHREGLIDLAHYTNDLVDYILKSYAEHGREVRNEIDVCTALMTAETVIPYGLLITELITNSIKYAKPTEEQLKLHIQLSSEEGGRYHLLYRDNGKGISSDVNWQSPGTMGLRLLTNLTKQLQGTIDYEFNDASIFNIKFIGT